MEELFFKQLTRDEMYSLKGGIWVLAPDGNWYWVDTEDLGEEEPEIFTSCRNLKLT